MKVFGWMWKWSTPKEQSRYFTKYSSYSYISGVYPCSSVVHNEENETKDERRYILEDLFAFIKIDYIHAYQYH